MEIRQLEYFITTAKHLNYTAAAAELNISQSTLSRQITAMEKELNLLLFFRDNRNVRLTACGNYLYTEYSALYAQYVQISQNAKEIFEGFSGNLKLGVLEEVILEGRMQDVLHSYHKKYANQTLDMRRGSFKNLTDGLLDMSYDFILTFFFDISNHTNFEYRLVENATHGIIISAKNPLARKKNFTFKDLKNEIFIIVSRDDSPLASNGAINHCINHGFYPRLKFAPNLDTAMLWVEAGLGLAFTYAKSIAAHNPSMTFLPFNEQDTIEESKLVLAWNTKNPNPAVKSFIKHFDNN